MARVVLQVPKIVRDRVKFVTATLADWDVTCDDRTITRALNKLKPERLGYLPSQEYDWALEAQRFMAARIISVEEDSTSGPDPGVCCSSGPDPE